MALTDGIQFNGKHYLGPYTGHGTSEALEK